MSDIDFAGETFRLADKIGLMPLMRFAHVSRRGVDSNDMEGLAAIYDLLKQCIADDDWGRFEDAAMTSRADGDELLEVVSRAVQAISERPTQEPSDSSDGQPITSGSSTDGSSSPVIGRLVEQGRPDLALIVDQAERSRVSA